MIRLKILQSDVFAELFWTDIFSKGSVQILNFFLLQAITQPGNKMNYITMFLINLMKVLATSDADLPLIASCHKKPVTFSLHLFIDHSIGAKHNYFQPWNCGQHNDILHIYWNYQLIIILFSFFHFSVLFSCFFSYLNMIFKLFTSRTNESSNVCPLHVFFS